MVTLRALSTQGTTGLVGFAFCLFVPTAAAQTVVELGDSGALPVSAQVETAAAISTITGEIDGSKDVDMYRITIDDPANFSATTDGGAGTISDTRLYLFDVDGEAVYFNDDISNDGVSPPNYLSTLPAGHPSGPAIPGDYFIAIVSYPKYASNGTTNLFLEPDFDPVAYDDVLGPNPATSDPISAWSGSNNQFLGTYEIALTGVNGTLAVDFLTLAARTDGDELIVTWTSGVEHDTREFHLQVRLRRADPSRETWRVIGGTPTRGDGSSYMYRIGSLAPGRYSVRLHYVESNGTSAYSETIESFVSPGVSILTALYPNPIVDQAHVVVSAPTEQRVTVGIFDVQGRHVMHVFDGRIRAADPVTVVFDGSHLPSGIYYLRVQGASAVETKRLVRIR